MKRNQDYHFAYPVKHEVDYLLADGVVPPRVVIGRVFLPTDQLLRMEQLPIFARPHLI